MKRIIAFVLAALMLAALLPTAFAAAPEVSVSAVNGTAEPYKPETVITVSGKYTAKKDMILRVFNEKNTLVYTDVLLSYDLPDDGEYSFAPFAIPNPVTKENNTGKVSYTLSVKQKDEADVTATFNVEVKKEQIIDSNNNNNEDPKSYTKKIEELAEETNKIKNLTQAVKAIGELASNTPKADLAKEEVLVKVSSTTEAMAEQLSRVQVAVGRSNSLSLDSSTIPASALSNLKKNIDTLRKAVSDNGIKVNRDYFRELTLNVKFTTNQIATVVINKEVLNILQDVDILTFRSDSFLVSYQVKELREALADQDVITITLDPTVKSENANAVKTVSVNFDTDKTSVVKVAFPGISGDMTYMSVVDEEGNPVGGKYNPLTGCIEAKLTQSGVYTVENREIDFTDIKDKDAEMQKAIKVLAAKGTIRGTSETEFSPDDAISRAEIAALILRIIAKDDANMDGEFADVTPSNWYYGTAGSAKAYGLIYGYPDNTFRGDVTIQKDQILAISARVLREEMRYLDPDDQSQWLNFSDSDDLADWAQRDISLASMAGLITRSTEGTLKPVSQMTRGDAALVIMKLFEKIW